MDSIQNLLNNGSFPVLTAFLLGLLTAISPCPLATNITAVGYISKNINNNRKVLVNGLLYTLGRILSYTVLGVILLIILHQGLSLFHIQKNLAYFGGVALGPLLVLIGLFMLFGHKLQLPKMRLGISGEKLSQKGSLGALLLGALFAMAFCPTSAVFYFGGLIPLAASETGGFLLPAVFAIATALPVIIVAFILAFSVGSLGAFYGRIQTLQKVMNVIVAGLFIVIGCYYCLLLMM